MANVQLTWSTMNRRKLISLIASCILVLAVLLWLAGKFSPKISPGTAALPTVEGKGDLVPVRLVKMPLTESAVGTVQAVHETTIASKLLSRVTEANIKAGQAVKKGEVLIRLDDTDLKAKLQQMRSGVAVAEAAYGQAVTDEKRLGTLLKSNAISQQEYDKASTRLKSSSAELKRSQEAVNEAQSILDYATILAPMDAVIIDKKVDAGDTVVPGQALLRLFDPSRMQLVANVREALALKLKPGQNIGVKIDSMDKTCSGTVSEIVPESSSASRTFLVKVTGPCPAGIYSGMFGRILIPLGEEDVLLIPAKAVRRTGQLENVTMGGRLEEGKILKFERRSIRTGRVFGDDVEVLSGLKEGEQILVIEFNLKPLESR